MKRIFAILATLTLAALPGGITSTAIGQVDATLATSFLNSAKAASDSQLGDIATQLTGKVAQLESLLGTNSAIKAKLDNLLTSLTGGQDSNALASAFGLVKGAKPTPEQLGLVKQVGNLASAYVVQKNFATLDGAQGDVATIVSSLREGKLTAAVPALKNVASNNSLTDGQKQLIKTVADKYAPGWEKAKGTVDAIKSLSGF